ncbi:MAG: glycyl-radical enzyme activating protein [Treponema sp.]|nr:glycyl-radical enzyme activating protein [Spirochaetia bacterium]MDD7460185.1 glycyl-radical enzyme activating protein [Spirochaetales bacterium]MDY5810736.1 glycyl-radical enzyme activating protein [Treponema sp.]MEE1180968.1 glycyl-radical enzyme activating protein [Treponema sp.]
MAISGYVMQLQPFSVNDGNGIRTTIFLAGCPLRCKWCSNPEGMSGKVLTGWYEKKCTGCGACAVVCPEHIGINLNQNREHCIGCGKCTMVCPAGARTRMVSLADADDMISDLQKDEIFYHYSGGGVTFSGGEAAAQPAFLDYLSSALYDRNISMALETCGYFDFEKVRKILERMDLIFMDLKLFDDARHRKYTGVSNKRILENIVHLAEIPSKAVIRIPVIGGVNNDEENIRLSARYVHENLPKAKMELLPYHKLGTVKYDAIGMPCPPEEFYRPSAEELEHLKSIVKSEGVELEDFR